MIFEELSAFLMSGGDKKQPPKGFEKFFKKKEEREAANKGKGLKILITNHR